MSFTQTLLGAITGGTVARTWRYGCAFLAIVVRAVSADMRPGVLPPSELLTYHDIIDEIYNYVEHMEPMLPGHTNGASTAFCLLYRFFCLRLTEKQILGLINHTGEREDFSLSLSRYSLSILSIVISSVKHKVRSIDPELYLLCLLCIPFFSSGQIRLTYGL